MKERARLNKLGIVVLIAGLAAALCAACGEMPYESSDNRIVPQAW